jgi:predicted DNA-binding mobile mystery protein A
MRATERGLARRQIDKRLNPLRNADAFVQPPRGWIRAIREALGMTTKQLAKRLGIRQPSALNLEKAEARGAITLETLNRAARALDCRLVYALVPRLPLETLVAERATLLAQTRLESTAHTMALEAQSLGEEDQQEHVRQLARQLLEAPGSALWDDI